MKNKNQIKVIQELLSTKQLSSNIQIHELVGDNIAEIVISKMNEKSSIQFYKVTVNYDLAQENPQLEYEVIPDILEHLETKNLNINLQSVPEKDKKGDSIYARRK